MDKDTQVMLAVGAEVSEVMANILSLKSQGTSVVSGSTEFELSATVLKGAWKVTVELV